MDDQISSKGTGTVKGVKINNIQKNPDANGIVDVGSVLTSDSNYVKKSGDTMTGYLTLNENPTQNLHAATKQYVDSKDGNFVHLTGNETITGNKTFNSNVTIP